MERRVTYVVAVKARGTILRDNFLSSPCLETPHSNQILVQENFKSAAEAYNDALNKAENDLVVFLHQDVLLPTLWPIELERSLKQLESSDPNWGVLGCYGATRTGGHEGRTYSNGFGIIGKELKHPMPVQTLDEMILIIRKSSGLRFDERLPYFHLYGADICLAAARKQQLCYAIPAFCIHNTRRNLILADEFYDCYRCLKAIWKEYLPIFTTCIEISKSDFPMYKRRLWETYLRYVVRREIGAERAENVREVLGSLEATSSMQHTILSAERQQ